ncbi:MAG: hypothetical protein E7572_03955 [Ruminococcaceae bacterium]|nr:hypothetical protein [Oscillospiraceae bacterium]
MLIKKELQTVPVLPYRKLKDKRYSKYAEFAQEVDLPRSGHIIAADYYSTGIGTHQLAMRAFYDGENVVSYTENGGWSNTKPGTTLGTWYGDSAVSAPEAKKIVQKLRPQRWGPDCLIEIFDDIVSCKYQEKRERAWKREQDLFETLTAMLPDYPKGLPSYCEKHVYGYTYIFLGKVKNHKRTAACQHCGHEFVVDGSVKPHQHGKCPHCGEAAEYFANWVHPPKEKRRHICICCRVHGNLIIRWAKVTRRFYGQNTEYDFEDYYRNFYIDDGKSQTLYAYHWVDNMGYSDWVRLRNGTENTEATYIYQSNLNQVFGRNMYGVNLAKELRGCKDEISITRFLDSLKNIPQAKYFLRLGMRRLVQGLYDPPFAVSNSYTGRTFAEVLGIRAQYLPLYQKYDVTMSEHAVIKACGEAWVDEEMFLKMREMDVREYEIASYNGFLKTAATIKKSINYLYKQYRIHQGNLYFGQLNDLWHDYLQMSVLINVDISNKQIKFPKDLVEAHNRLMARTAAIKDKIRAEKARHAFETIYSGIPQYRTAKYQIVFPQGEADFIREGQQLHHCVGCGTYFRRHIEGVCMIFFIRKADEPDKPYFTTEVNVEKRTIVQLYGDHDCQAPKEIRNFVEQFCKHIEPRGTDAQEERKLTA